MSNGFASNSRATKASAKWLQHVKRRQNRRRVSQEVDALSSNMNQLRDAIRPPAEPPPSPAKLDSVMTGLINPDQESAQYSSNFSTNAVIYDNDTICGIPPLCNRYDSSSDEESSEDEDNSLLGLPPLANRSISHPTMIHQLKTHYSTHHLLPVHPSAHRTTSLIWKYQHALNSGRLKQ
jgi:hypothetical protein